MGHVESRSLCHPRICVGARREQGGGFRHHPWPSLLSVNSIYLHPLPSLETGKDSCQWPWCQCDQPGRLLSPAYGCLAWPNGPRPPPAEARCLLGCQKHKPSCAAPPGLPAGPLPGMAPPPGQPSRCLVWQDPHLVPVFWGGAQGILEDRAFLFCPQWDPTPGGYQNPPHCQSELPL